MATELEQSPKLIREKRKYFTGTAHTLIQTPHQGFANYSIATLEIEEGLVKKMILSQPYAAFEAMLKLELINARHLESLRLNYPEGFNHV